MSLRALFLSLIKVFNCYPYFILVTCVMFFSWKTQHKPACSYKWGKSKVLVTCVAQHQMPLLQLPLQEAAKTFYTPGTGTLGNLIALKVTLHNIKSFPLNYLSNITYHGLPDPAPKHGCQKSPSSAPGEWYQLFWHHTTSWQTWQQNLEVTNMP